MERIADTELKTTIIRTDLIESIELLNFINGGFKSVGDVSTQFICSNAFVTSCSEIEKRDIEILNIELMIIDIELILFVCI